MSAIIAGIECAIENKADIINLSLYTKKTLATSVLEAEIQKAIDSGIIVIGAAGNSGDNAANYLPGSVQDAYIIGSCVNPGVKVSVSNYGDNVDCYAISNYTSNAAARFTGAVSYCGIDNIDFADSIFFKP